ncbi:conserved hypothetical protein [Candidatus Desulfarcum epimagneticum]|uniref:Phosphatidylglycerol lysyltransferase C-terminal domain-containing protein n=1 Tax=uncultured Desulfobacteraceae bacterium TaxID=218296 RepID=A0A484HHT4_9BACT|nr:conserved hypothetical protein [uncultured Desulfobacteraceae bacterium]
MKLNPITPRDYPELQKYFENQSHALCAYSLSSALVWKNDFYRPGGAIDGDALVISGEFSDPEKQDYLLLPVSGERRYSPGELRRLARRLDFERFSFAPLEYIDAFGSSEFKRFFDIVERKKYHDYVYRTENLAQLPGNRHSKKRNLINQFSRSHEAKNRTLIEPITPGNADECLEFLDLWCEERDCDVNPREDLACERRAAENALRNIDRLGFRGILLRIDRTVSAFGIASTLTREMGALHFEKAFAGIKGLYQHFDRECARRLFKGLTYINKESDMGVEGLAKAKKSYQPAMMVKSFDLVLKS